MNDKATAAALAIASSPALSSAQAPIEDPWRFYGYFPDIGGSTTFPITGISNGVTVDANTILKHLQGVFMGMGEVSKGPWGLHRRRDRPIAAHLAGHRRPRLLVQVGRGDRGLAISRLRHEIRQQDRESQLQRSGDRRFIPLVTRTTMSTWQATISAAAIWLGD